MHFTIGNVTLYIRTVLHPERGLQGRLLKVDWHDEKDRARADRKDLTESSTLPLTTALMSIEVEFGNIQNLPLEVIGLSDGGRPPTEFDPPIVLDPRLGNNPVRFERWECIRHRRVSCS